MPLRYVETNFAQSVQHLPTRHLPPGSVKMLYYEFSQKHDNISPPGSEAGCRKTFEIGFTGRTVPRYSTFWRRFKECWCQILRFLPSSGHATCDTCLDFKQAFKAARESWARSGEFWPAMFCCYKAVSGL